MNYFESKYHTQMGATRHVETIQMTAPGPWQSSFLGMCSSPDSQRTYSSASSMDDRFKLRGGSREIVAIIVFAFFCVVVRFILVTVILAILILLAIVQRLRGSVHRSVLKFPQTEYVDVALLALISGTKEQDPMLLYYI